MLVVANLLKYKLFNIEDIWKQLEPSSKLMEESFIERKNLGKRLVDDIRVIKLDQSENDISKKKDQKKVEKQ